MAVVFAALFYGLPYLGIIGTPVWAIALISYFTSSVLNNRHQLRKEVENIKRLVQGKLETKKDKYIGFSPRFSLRNITLSTVILNTILLSFSLWYLFPYAAPYLPMVMVKYSMTVIIASSLTIASLLNLADNKGGWKLLGRYGQWEILMFRTIVSSIVLNYIFPAIGVYHIALRISSYLLGAAAWYFADEVQFNPINWGLRAINTLVFNRVAVQTKEEMIGIVKPKELKDNGKLLKVTEKVHDKEVNGEIYRKQVVNQAENQLLVPIEAIISGFGKGDRTFVGKLASAFNSAQSYITEKKYEDLNETVGAQVKVKFPMLLREYVFTSSHRAQVHGGNSQSHNGKQVPNEQQVNVPA